MLHAEMVYMNTSCMCFRRSDDSKFGKGGIKSIWYTFWPQISACYDKFTITSKSSVLNIVCLKSANDLQVSYLIHGHETLVFKCKLKQQEAKQKALPKLQI